MINLIFQFALALIATTAIGVLFSAPKKELLLCGLSGAISWIVYYVIHQYSDNVVLPSLIAAFVLTVYSRCVAVNRLCPATTYLLPGIFPLVPGAGIYYTAYFMITNQPLQSSEKGLETLEVALAIVFGIIFGSAIPQSVFSKPAQNQ
jgi:uncharacterized membrane protein YjjB (DUF3815 family)